MFVAFPFNCWEERSRITSNIEDSFVNGLWYHWIKETDIWRLHRRKCCAKIQTIYTLISQEYGRYATQPGFVLVWYVETLAYKHHAENKTSTGFNEIRTAHPCHWIQYQASTLYLTCNTFKLNNKSLNRLPFCANFLFHHLTFRPHCLPWDLWPNLTSTANEATIKILTVHWVRFRKISTNNQGAYVHRHNLNELKAKVLHVFPNSTHCFSATECRHICNTWNFNYFATDISIIG